MPWALILSVIWSVIQWFINKSKNANSHSREQASRFLAMCQMAVDKGKVAGIMPAKADEKTMASWAVHSTNDFTLHELTGAMMSRWAHDDSEDEPKTTHPEAGMKKEHPHGKHG